MYGHYHPLYGRHLMHEYAMEREALRQVTHPEPVDKVPPRAAAILMLWVAVFGSLVVALIVLSVLLAADPSSAVS